MQLSFLRILRSFFFAFEFCRRYENHLLDNEKLKFTEGSSVTILKILYAHVLNYDIGRKI